MEESVPGNSVASVGDSLLQLLLSGLGGVGCDLLTHLGGEIFAAGVRHVDDVVGWLVWFGKLNRY